MPYTVYLLTCADGSYYCGYTIDLEKRLLLHNTSKKGAKYTASKRPVTLAYTETYDSLSEALKREAAIKRLNHQQKELLISA